MIECMVDLETFGLPPDGLIISIGAVKFDPEKMEIVDRLHLGIEPEACQQLDFTIHPGTVKWWLHDDRDEPRKAWLTHKKFDPGTALIGFSEWFGKTSMPTWGNAVTFDVVLLKHAFVIMGLPLPWKFWDERCHRTLKTICPETVSKRSFEMGIERAGSGVLHTALFDAEVQAYQNMLIRKAMVPRPAEPDASDGEHGVVMDALKEV